MDLELKKAIAKKKMEMMNNDRSMERPVSYSNAQPTGLELERATKVLSGKMGISPELPKQKAESVQVQPKYKTYEYESSPDIGEQGSDKELEKRIAQKKLRKQGM